MKRTTLLLLSASISLATGQTGTKTSDLSARPLQAGDKVIVATALGANAAGNVGDDVVALQAEDARTDNPHVVTKTQLGLSNADNTSDADKPISDAAQAALDLLAPIASPTFTGTVSGVTKAMVGLSNADNTSDADKPISDAAQLALDPLNVANVSALASLDPADGATVITQGYYAASDGGGNVYSYSLASAATVDGGFVIDGPGSVGRFLAVGQTVANAKQFGAVGDGVTDDTSSIQAAIDASRELAFSEGTYVTGTLTINDSLLVRGPGTVKLRDAANASLLDMSGAASNIVIKDLILDGNGANQTAWTETSRAVDIRSLVIERCEFLNSVVSAISTYSASDSLSITNSKFLGGKAHSGTLNEGTSFVIARAHATAESQRVVVRDCYFEATLGDHVGGILITSDTGGTAQQGSQCVIDGNTFKDVGQDLAGNAVAGVTLYRAAPQSRIVNNRISGGSEKGIDVQGSYSPYISGNIVNGVASVGISCVPRDGNLDVSLATVSGNVVTNCDTGLEFLGNQTASAATHVVIAGNTVTDCTQFLLISDWLGSRTVTNNIFSGATGTDAAADEQCISIIGSRAAGTQNTDSEVVFSNNQVTDFSNMIGFYELAGDIVVSGNNVSGNINTRSFYFLACTGFVNFVGNNLSDCSGFLTLQDGNYASVTGNTFDTSAIIRCIQFIDFIGTDSATIVSDNIFRDCPSDVINYSQALGQNSITGNVSTIAVTVRKALGSVVVGSNNLSITP